MQTQFHYNRNMRVVPILCLGLAHAGTYGSVHHAFAGYSTEIDCSVGHSTDHAAEARAFESCKQQGEAELIRRDAELAASYRLFVAHAKPSLASLLDRTAVTGEWEHAVSVELPRVSDGLLPNKNATLRLFVKATLSEALRYKLAAEFARTQLLDGGLVSHVRPELPHDLAQTQQILIGVGAHDSPLQVLQLGFLHRDELAQLAKMSEPLPKKAAGDQRPALVVARVIDAVLRSRPFADDTFTLAAQLDVNYRAQLALLIAVFSSDHRARKLSDDPLVAELLKL